MAIGYVGSTGVSTLQQTDGRVVHEDVRSTPSTFSIAVVHDYLTQRGGAERVVLSMLRAFPHASLHTSVYNEATTYPEFASYAISRSGLDRLGVLRSNHRLGLPLYGSSFGRLHVDADVMLCSSSGFAHGAQTSGTKVVYCYAPPRWLYQGDRYLGGRRAARIPLTMLRPWLVRQDQRAVRSADRYLTTSTAMRTHLRDVYGIDAEVLPPPHAVSSFDPLEAVEGVSDGYHLCVARLLPYKNVDAVVEAFRLLPDQELVVVGDGPSRAELERRAPGNVRFLRTVSDPQLRFLYRGCAALVSASFEDFGLTPLEAAACGRPSVVLRAGGFLDTVREGDTGVFFEEPTPIAIAQAVREAAARAWSVTTIKAHAATYDESSFHRRLRDVMVEALR